MTKAPRGKSLCATVASLSARYWRLYVRTNKKGALKRFNRVKATYKNLGCPMPALEKKLEAQTLPALTQSLHMKYGRKRR